MWDINYFMCVKCINIVYSSLYFVCGSETAFEFITPLCFTKHMSNLVYRTICVHNTLIHSVKLLKHFECICKDLIQIMYHTNRKHDSVYPL